MTETSESIAHWAEDTFGPAKPLSLVQRARLELDELEQAIINEEAPTAVLSEIADVTILLHRLSHNLGQSLDESVTEKMKINHARNWVRSNDGTGRHQ